MAYNTVSLKTDADGKPIPQYYNPVTNQYEVTQGENGATRTVLYDAYGNPVDLESLITAITNTLNARHLPIGASTEKKQNDAINKLSDILSNLPSNYSTETKQDEIIEKIAEVISKIPSVTNIETKQSQILNKMNPKTHYLLSTDEKPTTAEKGETVFEIDTTTVFMWDGTEWVVI